MSRAFCSKVPSDIRSKFGNVPHYGMPGILGKEADRRIDISGPVRRGICAPFSLHPDMAK